MELFTLTDNFRPAKIVDGFTSAIWTERYFTHGDTQIVVPANAAWRELLKEGTLLGLRGSAEVMLLETQKIKDGLMTASGATLDKFLNERQAWFMNPDQDVDAPQTAEYTDTTSAGQFLADVVNNTVIDPQAFPGGTSGANINLDWVREKIDNLILGNIDTNGAADTLRTFPIGPLYDGIQQVAQKEGLGFKLFLSFVDALGYILEFSVYRGRDKTSEQSVNPLVRLSPELNSLSDIEEILSISEYKNVVYVYYKNAISTHYAEPDLPIPEGFARRSFIRTATGDIPIGEPAEIAYRAQHARDAFANNNYIRAIDGQTSGPNRYIFNRHYRLGDIIELEGLTGALSKARVTEYIRSQDELGNREYPTISVVDPLDSGNMPTVDPSPDPGPDPDPYGPDPYDPDPYPNPIPDPDSPYAPPEISDGVEVTPSPYPPPTSPDPDPDPDPPDPGPSPPDPVPIKDPTDPYPTPGSGSDPNPYPNPDEDEPPPVDPGYTKPGTVITGEWFVKAGDIIASWTLPNPYGSKIYAPSDGYVPSGTHTGGTVVLARYYQSQEPYAPCQGYPGDPELGHPSYSTLKGYTHEWVEAPPHNCGVNREQLQTLFRAASWEGPGEEAPGSWKPI